MWKVEMNNGVLEATPTGLIEKIEPDHLKFFELTGSGAGDQYIFQGEFPLAKRLSSYNLAVYSLGPSWDVIEIWNHQLRSVTPEIKLAGKEFAQKLAATLPKIENHGARHSLEWLQKAWKDAKAWI